MLKTKVLVDGLVFPECPRWHEGKLWFSDMVAGRVMTVDLSGNVKTVVRVPGQPAGLGLLPDGRLLIVSMINRQLLRLDTDGLTEVADLSKLASCHCNDMVVDSKGRAYIGNFGFDPYAESMSPASAEIILVTPDGEARVVADELLFPNGSVITLDERTLIVSESFGYKLTAFDIESDGSLTGRRTWAQFDNVLPDGICLDAEGAVWVASATDKASSEVIRVLEGGEVTHRVKVSSVAFACMLGGPDRRTLFVATSDSSHPGKALAKKSGRIEYVGVEVAGAGFP